MLIRTTDFSAQIYHIIMLCLVIGLVAACTSPESNTPEATDDVVVEAQIASTSRPPVGLDPTPTVPAPTYREPSTPITLENVAQIEYLGRLDTPGRKSTIFDWTISPDGTQLTALNNDLLIEWNIVTGDINFNTSRGIITSVLYSSDKSEIYAIEADGQTKIYQSVTGNELNTVSLHENYSGIIAYDDLNGWLAVVGTDNSIKVWDMQVRESLITFDAHEEVMVDIAFSSDGKLLASTAIDSKVKLWNWQEETLLAEYDLQNAIADSMVFAPDDSQLAVSTQNFVGVWNVWENDLDFVLQTGRDTANEVLAFSPDSKYLATAGEQGNMRLWNTENSNLEIELPDIGGNRVGATFSPDSSLLATTMLGRDASLWNLTDITDRTVGRAPLTVQSNNLFGVEWSSDGFTLLFFDASGEIYVWGVPVE